MSQQNDDALSAEDVVDLATDEVFSGMTDALPSLEQQPPVRTSFCSALA